MYNAEYEKPHVKGSEMLFQHTNQMVHFENFDSIQAQPLNLLMHKLLRVTAHGSRGYSVRLQKWVNDDVMRSVFSLAFYVS